MGRNHEIIYRFIAVDLSRQKELDVDQKTIQQIEFIAQLKKLDADDNATDAGNDQSMFVLTILEKIKQTRLQFSQGSVTDYKRWQIIKKRELNEQIHN